ncbi:alpha/beta hydrolase [Novosphingobium album (ex Hu et al. 2023)]|uniref:Alpha/beta hydrolase n=1 Tax=Novosphingobium album (ex Hu et al. 2023) TaxID=2930093 RepID=A0ABT0B3A0_9SPHN|nr:alpha/beta hydrolase [Novosphingobium album (ex Hu et al. 2023)]MCJ2179294.1 alpha/beta hydrolase [Novosphingobium album (ex Hu et al. 2023)]
MTLKTGLALSIERPGYPAPPDLAERRAQMAAGIAAGMFATMVPPLETELAGLRTLRFDPPGTPRGYVLQLHGGGFRIGRPEFEGPFAEALAARCGVTIVVPQYRLSPETPFPGGLNDALAALQALQALSEEADEAPLIVSGDSAGAGLAASIGLMTAAGLTSRVDGLVLLSPWLDLTVTAPSFAANAASDPLFGTKSARVAADLYLQGFDPQHPLASPVFAGDRDLQDYPPCLISVGTGEVLLDDSWRFHARLNALGRDSRLVALDGMEHVAVVRGRDLPGSAETFAAITSFVDGILERAPRPGED